MNDLLFLPPKIQGLNFKKTVVKMFGETANHYATDLEGERIRFVIFSKNSQYTNFVFVFPSGTPRGAMPGVMSKELFVDWIRNTFC